MTREWNGSLVMGEFAKIAAESGLITTDFGKPVVGNPDKETPVKDHRRHEPGKEYGVTKETGEELVGEAHPKDAKPAESMGEGALVENIVQQQEKDIEVATSMPSGALTGKHAALVDALIALANDLESEGRSAAAGRIDKTIERISGIPFGEGLRKEAFWAGLLTALRGLFWAGTAGVAAWKFGPGVVSALTSKRESLAKDIQDVIDDASAVRGDDPSMSAVAERLRSMLSPYVAKFRRPMPPPGDEAGLKDHLATLGTFATMLPEIQGLVTALTAVKGGWSEGAGFGPRSQLESSFKDMMATFQDTAKAVAALAGSAGRPPEAGKPEIAGPGVAKPAPTGISEIQSMLAAKGLEVPQTGKLDDATKAALRTMEQMLDTALRRKPRLAKVLDDEGWSIAGQLLRPDGTVVDPSILRRYFKLAYGREAE